MGSPVLVTGKVSGFIGNVPGPPGGSRGSTNWGHQPQKAAWAKCGRGGGCAPSRVPFPGVVAAPRSHLGGGQKGRGGMRTMISSDEPRCRGFNQSRIQFPLSIGMLLARDSIVGIPIPSSISLPASLFTRSITHHPMINSLVTLCTL